MNDYFSLKNDISAVFDGDSSVFCVIAPNKEGTLTVSMQIPPQHIDDFRDTLSRIDFALSSANE